MNNISSLIQKIVRTVVTVVAAAAVGTAVVACSSDDKAGENAKSDQAKLAVATEMVEAWNARDWEKVYALFSDDGVLHSMMLDPLVGRESIRARLTPLTAGIEQIELKIRNMGVVGEVVIIERVDDFIYKGNSGQVPVVGVMEIVDGQVSVWREYYDYASLEHALMAGPPSQGDMTAAAREEIGELTDKLQHDWNGGNMDAYLDAYWKDERMSLMFGGQAVRGWQALSELFRGSWTTEEAMGDFSVSNMEVRLIRPEIAIASGSFEHRFPNETVNGSFSHVWRNFDEQGWLIVHEHTSRAH